MPEPVPVRTVDFNRILTWVNVAFAGVMLFALAKFGPNEYLDGESVGLALAFGLQTHLALMVERHRRDPFVVLLAFILIFYFTFRVCTLLLIPFSFVLDRYEYTVADSNRALLFIMVANVFLYAGLFAVRGGPRLRIDVQRWHPVRERWMLALVIATIVFIYTRGVLWSSDAIPRALVFLLLFLSQSIVLLMALAYYILYRDRMRPGHAMLLLGLLVLEMVLHSLAGSRSAFIYSIQNVIIVLLAVQGSFAIRRRLVAVGLAIMPLAVALFILAFTISTFIRANTEAGQSFSVTRAIETARSASVRVGSDYALRTGLGVMASRAGFFDYSAEVIAHAREYSGVISPPTYVRSIIDNLLTPGFDLFDQPKISNALIFVYSGLGTPSKNASMTAYQSDQLGIWGELYVLMGWASLPIFFLAGFLFKRSYVSLRGSDPFVLTMKRVVTLSAFALVVNSFGLDWVVMDVLPMLVAIYIYRYFFAAAPLPPSVSPT